MLNVDEKKLIGFLIIGLIGFLIIGGAIGLIAAIDQPSWREMVGMLSGGAIGALLVYGYQRWIKRPNRGGIDRRK